MEPAPVSTTVRKGTKAKRTGPTAEDRGLREELLHARQQADEASKEFDLLCYSISHDLRAPLRAIDGFSAILLEDYQERLDDEGKRYLQIIRDSTRQIVIRIEALLELSRLGRRTLNPAAIDMTALASTVFDDLKAKATEREITCEVGELPPAFADREMIRELLVELLANALKFTRVKTKALISINGKRAGKENIYAVNDNGAGFDMEYAGNLFGLFQKLHSSKIYEGEGLGLAKVRRIADRHGGRVWAEGTVDKGATFFFTLPAADHAGAPERDPAPGELS